MTRKALATIGCGPMERVLEQSLPTFVEFGNRHGYDVVSCSTDEYSFGRPASWGRIRMLRELMDTYDLVLWIDADAIILDNSIDPAGLLGPDHHQALPVLRQLGTEFPSLGVWLLRSTPKAKSFLDAIWAKEEFIDHPYWEMAAALTLLGYSVEPTRLIAPTEWMSGTLLLEEEWNFVPLTTRSLSPCRIRHYGGERNSLRIRQMKTDRHGLAARTTLGWRRRWHAAAAAAGLLRWTLWDGPMERFGAVYRLRYRAKAEAYGVARRVGLVAVVRRLRRKPNRARPV